MKQMKIRIHMIISGRVQGVFFRQETKRQADLLNVKGWIRNQDDGKVEAILEGEEQEVQALIDYCKHGPSRAKVTNIRLNQENYIGEFSNFSII